VSGYDLGDCLADPGRGPAELTADRVLDERIRGQIRQLKPDERTALGLLGLGYSYEEISALRGWSYTKVNRCVSEGRARLREAVREG
jgi:DNA-directed RNA polymerase specialized sigma24 family protein